MKKINISDTTNIQLDWLVAKCEGRSEPEVVNNFAVAWYTWGNTHYSADPAQAYPIIERQGIGFFCNRTAEIGARFTPDAGADWRAFALNKHGEHHYGPTPLIAAMRCYVVSKLGDTVEIPEEL